MTDTDKVNLIYRYLFYGEVKYSNRVRDLTRVCKLDKHISSDFLELYQAEKDLEFFKIIETDILKLLDSTYFG